jgi:hypothetical protein
MAYLQVNRRRYQKEMKYKNGFYVEVCNKDVKKGIRIWSKDPAGMQTIAEQYAGYKDVILLGEFRDGIPFKIK